MFGPTLNPGLFDSISTGVAFVRTFGCAGQPIADGSGFLVGKAVVMTARHVVSGSCEIRTSVGGHQFTSSRFTYWQTGNAPSGNADVATYRLNSPSTGHVFSFRSASPSVGTNLAMVGHPLGNGISLNQGPVIERLTNSGIPLLAVRMLGAQGASGSPFVDNAGRVAGILQIGLGSIDVLGQRTSGVLVGIDLARWWGSSILRDLCRGYPEGGIPSCGSDSSGTSNSPPPHSPKPPAVPKPPRSTPLAVQDCWASSSTSFDPAAKTYSVAPSDQDIYFIAHFNRPITSGDSVSLHFWMDRPDGTEYSSGTFDASGTTYSAYSVKFHLAGTNGLGLKGGNWPAYVALNDGSPCSFALQVQTLFNPMNISVSPAQFDPYSAFELAVTWQLTQEVDPSTTFELRLVSPGGSTVSDQTLYVSAYSTSGIEYLFLPFCSRFLNYDTCSYGTYRIDLYKSGALVWEGTAVGSKP